ncbi:NADAR family protein [Shewanella sp.]|uniref:NADAR family protein n=1 Tax=Shewanella sp. TaxID=50422 RepID=UPI003A9792AB
MSITSNQQLIDYMAQQPVKFIHFWGHQPAKSGVTKSCFSQWYQAPFSDGEHEFLTAEHYMMYHKAMLFDNQQIAANILACQHPNEAKQWGRKVRDFDEARWNAARFDIVVQGNYLKFTQHAELKAFLLNTGERILVEASPVDNIWGIGLAADDAHSEQPQHWRGLNLLGYALMAVREQLRAA